MPHDFDRLREHPAVLWVFIPPVALSIWYRFRSCFRQGWHPSALAKLSSHYSKLW
jgi:hypothetical protein